MAVMRSLLKRKADFLPNQKTFAKMVLKFCYCILELLEIDHTDDISDS